MDPFRLSLANLRFPSTPEESIALAVQAIDEASTKGVRIICFPECFVPGYRGTGKSVPPPDPVFLERAWSAVAEAAGKSNITVVLGTERVAEGALVATALVINQDGSVAGFQDKVQIDPSEESTYTPGTGRRVFRADSLTFGIVICHEGWRYPETVRRSALCRAAENTCYFATVNFASLGSPTTSAIVRPDGTLLSYQPYGEEGLLIADIDVTSATGLLATRLRTVFG